LAAEICVRDDLIWAEGGDDLNFRGVDGWFDGGVTSVKIMVLTLEEAPSSIYVCAAQVLLLRIDFDGTMPLWMQLCDGMYREQCSL